ncbi:hypothetical protein QQ045_021187 [Rhodiola kirilowii]
MANGEFCVDFASQKPVIGELPPPDVLIVTSGGSRIPAHGSVLGKMSPVLDGILDRPCKRGRGSERLISIPGVPCKAVAVFIRFLYSYRCEEEEIEKYGVHLLALSHVYMLPTLKHRCARALTHQLTCDNVVDKLKLARLCDAPYLSLKCMNMIANHFKEVKKTEGWMFLQHHDPWLELEILQFIDETETRKRKARKLRKDQSMYLHLSEAMDCLEHICTEGCTTVGPHNIEPAKNKPPCSKFSTCQGLQLLIRHFAQCKKRVNGGCLRCKRMCQLFQLHSSICDKFDDCQVPLCRQFKLKGLQRKQRDEAQWKLLVKKVVSAKIMSYLLLPKSK